METETQRYRDEYRERILPAGYRGVAHAVVVAIAGAAMFAAAAWQVDWNQFVHLWWVIPATFVLANLVEYLVHRHVMHRELPGLRAMFDRHTRRHHRYFTQRDIEVTAARDMHAVLFPPVLLVFFTLVALAFATPLALAFGRSAGWLFFLVALGYYLAYEVLHLLAHWPLRRRLARSTLVRRLVMHHRLHHEPPLMRRGNFNIVLPLGDWLFGTLHRDVPAVAQTDKPAPGPSA
jgi:hypothetical protein